MGAENVQMGIRAFHQVMWNKTFAGHTKLCYILLKGAHKEKAFVNVEVAQHCQDQGFAPLISPQTCYNSMYVNHPMAVIKFRAELAHFMAQKNSALAQAMIVKMNDKGTVRWPRPPPPCSRDTPCSPSSWRWRSKQVISQGIMPF